MNNKINLNPTVISIVKDKLKSISIGDTKFFSDGYVFFAPGFNKSIDKRADKVSMAKINDLLANVEDVTDVRAGVTHTFLDSEHFEVILDTKYYVYFRKLLKDGYTMKINKSEDVLVLFDKKGNKACGCLGKRVSTQEGKDFLRNEMLLEEYEKSLEVEKQEHLKMLDEMFEEFKEFLKKEQQEESNYFNFLKGVIAGKNKSDFRIVKDGIFFDYDNGEKVIENVPLFDLGLIPRFTNVHKELMFKDLKVGERKHLYNKILNLYIG